VAELRAEPALVEEAVFQAFRAGGRAAAERRWSREREAVYLQAPAERAAAFGAVARRWFVLLGFEALLERCLAPAPHVRASVLELHLKRASGPRAEGSELYEAEDGLRLVLRVAAARFGDRARLEEFLLRELARAEDMLDPAFGYRAELGPGLPGGDPRSELVRDRLRALWELRLSGRVSRLLGRECGGPPAGALQRAFAGLAVDELAELAERTRTGELACFRELLERARAEPGPVAVQPRS
jgi:hypothetical protein